MNTKIERFFTFIMKEKTRNFFAFAFYILFIVMSMEIDLPFAVEIICFIFLMFIEILGCMVYMCEWANNICERNRGKLGKNIINEIKKIGKEILMFIPVLLISDCVISFIMVGQTANQTSLEKSFYEAPIFNLIFTIIIGPIIEELIFRFLPYRFIKNKTLYIIVSTVVFVAMHVLNDPNPFYYIWFYMMRPLYYGYRYHKTKDILVPFSMHSLNNLVAMLLFLFS